jgi:hypothetical protein
MIQKLFVIVSLLFLTACKTTPVNIIDGGKITIQYSVEKTSLVRLYIENAYGTKVMTLVEKQQNYGNYSVQFSLTGLPEGVYYYVLSIGGNQTIRKKIIMLLP